MAQVHTDLSVTILPLAWFTALHTVRPLCALFWLQAILLLIHLTWLPSSTRPTILLRVLHHCSFLPPITQPGFIIWSDTPKRKQRLATWHTPCMQGQATK